MVETTIDQDGPEATQIGVDLVPDPTGEQISRVLDTMAEAETGRTTVYVDVGELSYSTGPMAGRSGIRNADQDVDATAAAGLLRAGLDFVNGLDNGASVDVDLDPVLESTGPPPVVTLVVPDASPSEVSAVERAVAGDETLGEENVYVVSS